MGQTPAKMFNTPQPFGSSPQGNNVSETQPLAFNQGPGFAAAGAFDQTQQTPQPATNFAGGGGQNIFNLWRQPRGASDNPFAGMMQQ